MKPPKGETITAKQRLWVKHVVAGMSDVVAYEKAFKCTRKNAEDRAYIMRTKIGVKSELVKLQDAAWNEQVVSIAERKAFLSGGMRATLDEVDEKSPYCMERVSNSIGDSEAVTERVKKIDPVSCIKELNRMERVYSDVTVDISVVGSLIEQIRNGVEPKEDE